MRAMNRLFCRISLWSAAALLSSAPRAFAAEVVPTEALICTRDFNAWGKASICECPEETPYDRRVGGCIRGAFDPVEAEGEIVAPAMAIGGETTGVELVSTAAESFELILPVRLKYQLEQAEIGGQIFHIQGDALTLPSAEGQDRPAIIVNSLTPLESDSFDE